MEPGLVSGRTPPCLRGGGPAAVKAGRVPSGGGAHGATRGRGQRQVSGSAEALGVCGGDGTGGPSCKTTGYPRHAANSVTPLHASAHTD